MNNIDFSIVYFFIITEENIVTSSLHFSEESYAILCYTLYCKLVCYLCEVNVNIPN